MNDYDVQHAVLDRLEIEDLAPSLARLNRPPDRRLLDQLDRPEITRWLTPADPEEMLATAELFAAFFITSAVLLIAVVIVINLWWMVAK